MVVAMAQGKRNEKNFGNGSRTTCILIAHDFKFCMPLGYGF